MLRRIKDNKWSVIIIIIFAIYSIIQCSTFILFGDDYWWSSLDNISQVWGDSNPNGRYLTNILTYYLIKNPFIRPFICSFFLLAFYFLISKNICKNEHCPLAFIISAFTIILIPSSLAMFTTLWISGFTNYLISLVFTLLFIKIISSFFNGEETKLPLWTSIPVFLIGFFGALCVENITIYNDLVAVFICFVSFIRFKKLNKTYFSFLIGTFSGSVIMFMNQNYHQLASGQIDQQGFRSVEIDFSEIISALYRDISPSFSHSFMFIHLSITVSLLILYYRKYGFSTEIKKPKYAKLFIPLIICYTVYSVFSQIFCGFVSLTPALKINAVLLAVAFLYIIGIIYMSYYLLNKPGFFKFTFFICSMLLVTAPFIVVRPVTPRCFFATYIFWWLAAGMLVIEALDSKKIIFEKTFISLLSIVLSSVCFILSYIYISNYIVDRLRFNYIKEQYNSNSKVIDVIDLPYEKYNAYSSVLYNIFSKYNSEENIILDDSKTYYADYILKYYGIDKDLLDKSFVEISIQDYFLAHSDE